VTDRELTADSKFLTHVLRHNPDAIGPRLDDAGWIRIDTLLTALAAHGRPLSPDRLDRLIADLDKQRFETRDGRIRAAQGHSIHVDLDLAPVHPPAVLYHGTVDRFLISHKNVHAAERVLGVVDAQPVIAGVMPQSVPGLAVRLATRLTKTVAPCCQA
jgi:RNA:NAD 2'-phosphotransferase (TPT1/KptA family)